MNTGLSITDKTGQRPHTAQNIDSRTTREGEITRSVKVPPCRGAKSKIKWKEDELERMIKEKNEFPKFCWKDFTTYWNEIASENGWPGRTEGAIMQKYSSTKKFTPNQPVEDVPNPNPESRTLQHTELEVVVAIEETIALSPSNENSRDNCNTSLELEINNAISDTTPTLSESIVENIAANQPSESERHLDKIPKDKIRSFKDKKYKHNKICKQKDDSNHTEGQEEVRKDLLHKEYLKHMSYATGTLDRLPLRVPKNTSRVEWRWCDEILSQHPGFDKDLKTININAYAIGAALVDIHKSDGQAKRVSDRAALNKDNETKKSLIKYIGIITGELDRRKIKAKPTPNQKKNLYTIRRIYKVKNTHALMSRLENLKARLKLVQEKLTERKNEKERRKQRQEPIKKLFEESAPQTEQLTNPDNIRDYWANLIGKKFDFKKIGPLKAWSRSLKIQEHELDSDSVDWTRFKSLVAKTKSYKAPGPDGIPNVIWKNVGRLRKALFEQVCRIKTNKFDCPRWLAKGRIVTIPKTGDLSDPANYRPIACLNTMYKVISGTICSWIESHVSKNNAFAESQRALTKGEWGCTHAHVLDQTAVKSLGSHKHLHSAWVDYSKAFDSIPHTYINYVLSNLKVHRTIRNAIASMIKMWCVRYEVRNNGIVDRSAPLIVKRGVLQGDSLSPLLFCLAELPISHALNQMQKCDLNTFKINHLYYMDDLKVYATSEEKLNKLLEKVEEVSSAVGLKMNSKKCAKVSNERHTVGRDKLGISYLSPKESYKYLGIEQSQELDVTKCWEKIREKTLSKMNIICGSHLTARQIIRGFNSTIVPMVGYFFEKLIFPTGKYNTIKNRAAELDNEIRKVLVKNKLRGKVLNVSRLYLDPRNGGLGLRSLTDQLEVSLVYTWCYIWLKENLTETRALLQKETKRNIHSDVLKILKNEHIPVEISARDEILEIIIGSKTYSEPTKAARAIAKHLRMCKNKARLESWRCREKAGAIARDSEVDQEISYLWIEKGAINKEAMRNALMCQEMCLCVGQLNNNDTKCRRCGIRGETVQHVVAGCPTFRKSLMLERHNGVCRTLHRELCRKYGLRAVHYRENVPPIMENHRVKIVYDQHIVTRIKLKHNRPDIVVFDKETSRIMIIEVGITWFTTLSLQHNIKYSKYATNSNMVNELELPYPVDVNLQGQIGELHGKEFVGGVKTIPIIIGCCGEVQNQILSSLAEFGLSQKRVKKLLELIQRNAVLGTNRLIKAHLSIASSN